MTVSYNDIVKKQILELFGNFSFWTTSILKCIFAGLKFTLARKNTRLVRQLTKLSNKSIVKVMHVIGELLSIWRFHDVIIW